MRIPADIARQIQLRRSLGVGSLPDGTVTDGFQWGWGGTAYPPPGYLPWKVLEVGNGDTYGFYWPIGKENDPPCVCTIMHDEGALVPLNSSLAGFIRTHLRIGFPSPQELRGLAKDFDISLDDLPLSGADEDDEQAEIDISVQELLRFDPKSPQQRLAAAEEAIAGRQVDEAGNHLRVLLDLFPEYSEALRLLAQVHRQTRNQRGAADAMMQALTSPICFGARDRRKLLNWLQRMGDEVYPDCPDPLWLRRGELTFDEGVYERDDYRVFEELIEAYHRSGMGVRAVRLRVLTGELMGRETVSFQERANWTGLTFRTQLKADLERAGLQARLVAV